MNPSLMKATLKNKYVNKIEKWLIRTNMQIKLKYIFYHYMCYGEYHLNL
jgi:hypothetical protein